MASPRDDQCDLLLAENSNDRKELQIQGKTYQVYEGPETEDFTDSDISDEDGDKENEDVERVQPEEQTKVDVINDQQQQPNGHPAVVLPQEEAGIQEIDDRSDADGDSDGEDGDNTSGINVALDGYDQIQIPGEKKEKLPLKQRIKKGWKAFKVSCFHDCQRIDKIVVVSHVVLILVELGEAVISTFSKIHTHNQCYLKSAYRSDGSMDFRDMWWCDMTLYTALATMIASFLFIMVNWTAQLNRMFWWMLIKLGLHMVGWGTKITAAGMLVIAYNSWCTSLNAARYDSRWDHPEKYITGQVSCLDAAVYFDSILNDHDTMQQKLFTYTIFQLALSALGAFVWTVVMILNWFHFVDYWKKRNDPHKEDEDYLAELRGSDDEDDDMGDYPYPEYTEELGRELRRRHLEQHTPNLLAAQRRAEAAGITPHNQQPAAACNVEA